MGLFGGNSDRSLRQLMRRLILFLTIGSRYLPYLSSEDFHVNRSWTSAYREIQGAPFLSTILQIQRPASAQYVP